MTAAPIPLSANEFIERQLYERNQSVAQVFSGEVLAFSGGLVFGVDDVIRTVVESVRQKSSSDKLIVMLTTAGGYIEVV